MADKMTFMKKWIDDIREDENLDVSEQELAYIVYAAVSYGVTGDKINLGDTFGKEFKYLNYAMSNIYGQIDNIQSYGEEKKASILKYDSDAIYALRMQGYTAKEICIEFGYPIEKANNITSNKGWVRAGQDLKELKVQKSGNSGKSVTDMDTDNTDGPGFDF